MNLEDPKTSKVPGRANAGGMCSFTPCRGRRSAPLPEGAHPAGPELRCSSASVSLRSWRSSWFDSYADHLCRYVYVCSILPSACASGYYLPSRVLIRLDIARVSRQFYLEVIAGRWKDGRLVSCLLPAPSPHPEDLGQAPSYPPGAARRAWFRTVPSPSAEV